MQALEPFWFLIGFFEGLLADMGRIKLTENDLEHAMEWRGMISDSFHVFRCIWLDVHRFSDPFEPLRHESHLN